MEVNLIKNLRRTQMVNYGKILGAGCCLLCAVPVFAAGSLTETPSVYVSQQTVNQCTGVVKDAAGETVIGASVVVKGTTNGTITGIDGSFMLPDVKKGDVIQISFVGYVTQEVVWKGAPLNVTLKEDAQALEEVVVVGYGTQKKVNLSGAVAQVSGEVLENRPLANVGAGLQGNSVYTSSAEEALASHRAQQEAAKTKSKRPVSSVLPLQPYLTPFPVPAAWANANSSLSAQ